MNTEIPFARLKRAFAVTVLLTLALLSTANAASGGNASATENNPVFSAIHVFGDSLSDTGNTAVAIRSTLGLTFPPPPYVPGRVSNGPVWVEYFAPMVRATYRPQDNFSWAGATSGTLNVLSSTYGFALPGMQQAFNGWFASTGGNLDRKALYVVFGGSNDFLQILANPTSNPEPAMIAGVSRLITYVATLRAYGAENIVVVDVPNIGLTPRALYGPPGTSAAATQLSAAFNRLLNASLDQLNFPICRVSLFNLLNEFVSKPAKFGFTNVNWPGFFNPPAADTYLFWDDVHPTTRGHRYLAEEIFHAVARAGMLGQQKK